jgi:hypothetical protein
VADGVRGAEQKQHGGVSQYATVRLGGVDADSGGSQVFVNYAYCLFLGGFLFRHIRASLSPAPDAGAIKLGLQCNRQLSLSSVRRILSEGDSEWKISHGIMDELLTQFREFVPLGVLKRGFHGALDHSPLAAALRRLPEKVTGVIFFAVLADDAARTEIANQQLEEISFGRIFSHLFLTNFLPYPRPSDSCVIVNRYYNVEM